MDEFDYLRRLQDDLLGRNEWLCSKINPGRRLKDHREYFQKRFPELFEPKKQSFLDIGCGPGESLILASSLGHDAMGIETPIGAGGMGDDYVSYGIRNHILNGVNVAYGSATDVIKALPKSRFTCVNMRGSLEQVFSHCMEGIPHDKHHRADLMTWNFNLSLPELISFGSSLSRCMQTYGKIVIHANGSANHGDLKRWLQEKFGYSGIYGRWIEEHVFEGFKDED